MFNKHEDVASAKLTELPDDLLDEVAGGQGGLRPDEEDGHNLHFILTKS